LHSVLVRTGKFREEALDEATVKPEGVIDSIAALPDWLEQRR
jgi:ribonucleotide monophosphatase NagD (HAD superfamily)